MSEQRNLVFGEQQTTEQRIKLMSGGLINVWPVKLMSGGHLPTLQQFRYGEIKSKCHVECLNNFS